MTEDIRRLTVTTPATSTQLTLLSTVKRALDLSVSTHDTFLIESISRASSAITAYLGRVLAQETVVEKLWLARCRPSIALRRYPAITVTSIVEDGVTLGALDTDYLIQHESGQIFRLSAGEPSHWPAGVWITITYQGGYALLGALPYAIEDACIRLVKSAYAAKGRDPMLKADEVAGLGRQEFWVGSTSGADLPDDVVALIAPYRDMAL